MEKKSKQYFIFEVEFERKEKRKHRKWEKALWACFQTFLFKINFSLIKKVKYVYYIEKNKHLCNSKKRDFFKESLRLIENFCLER